MSPGNGPAAAYDPEPAAESCRRPFCPTAMTRRPPRPASLLTLCLTLWVAAAGAFSLVGCGGGDSAKADAEFIYATRGPINVLDPNSMSWMQDIQAAQEMFEGVYRLDPTDPELKPVLGAAGDVKVSDDGYDWTVTLRPDLKWSNGDRVTAGDFVFAWQRNLREWSDYSYLIGEYVEGANAYHAAYVADPTTADFDTVGVKAVDDQTIRIRLQYPITFFRDLLAFTVYWPQPEKAMAKFKQTNDKGGVTYDAAWTRPENMVCNGPYKLTEWQQGVELRMAMNDFYWGRDQVKSRTIKAITNDNGGLALEQYDAGQIDWLSDGDPDLLIGLLKEGRKDVYVFPGYGTYFYSFNCLPNLPDGRPNPFADKKVRQALTMAIDKRPIVDNVTRLGEPTTANYVPVGDPPFFGGYKPPQGLAFDIPKARALLEAAGYPEGKDWPGGITLLYDTDSKVHPAIAQIVSKQWKDNLGIAVELEPIENRQFKKRLNTQQYAVARASWYGDYMDISTFTDKYLSESDNNDAKWKNPEYDRLLNAALRTTDVQKRYDELSRAEGILLDDAPIIPLYHYVNNFLHRDDVKGIPTNGRKMVSMRNISTPRSTGPGMTAGADQTAAAN